MPKGLPAFAAMLSMLMPPRHADYAIAAATLMMSAAAALRFTLPLIFSPRYADAASSRLPLLLPR